ncbi:MAG: hypothetical protein JSU08_10110 [Acidobacteria bacterium]|nr:hypothetical protein [Acidobacteriota bacterium]
MTSRARQFLISLLLTAGGIALSAFGGVRAISGMHGLAEQTKFDQTGILLFSAGAACFSVGFMWLIVALVRPFFEKREVDHIVDEMVRRKK